MPIELFVSMAGSPYGDGSPGHPVPDLVAARDVLRRSREAGESAVVWIAPGTYRVDRVLWIEQQVGLDLNRPRADRPHPSARRAHELRVHPSTTRTR